MREKNKFQFILFGICFLILFFGCETEKDILQTSEENSKQMKREISFKQFKKEIGQPNFNTGMSLSVSETGRNLEDFRIDTTLVKSIETNYVVYAMKLDPKFIPLDGKFYNLFVYKDNLNQLVKEIIEFLPQSEITNYDAESIYNYLQIAEKKNDLFL